MSFKRFLITFAGFLFVSAFAFADNAQRLNVMVDFFVDGDHIVIWGAPQVKEIHIPSEIEVDGIVYPVTEISENAFQNQWMLETLYLPATINRINLNAFKDTAIQELYIDDLVSWCKIYFVGDTESGNTWWSENCESNPINKDTKLYVDVESIGDVLIIPSGVISIKDYTFQRLNIKKLIIGDDCEEIYLYAFKQSGYQLQSIEFKSFTPPLMIPYNEDKKVNRSPGFSKNDCTLYVPQGCYQTYRDDPYWGEFLNIEETALSAGIENIAPEEEATDAVYDLYGRQVDPSNLSKGIYIRNGKKFMVK